MSSTFFRAVSLLAVLVLCTSAQAWNNEIGGNGGRNASIQCPPSHFAVGIAVRHDKSSVFKPTEAVIQARLRCSQVNSSTGNWAGSLRWTAWSPTDRLEGTQGLETSSSICPQHHFIDQQVKGKTTNIGVATVVGSLEFRCARFDRIDSANGTSRKRVTNDWRRVGGRLVGEALDRQSVAVNAGNVDTGIFFAPLRVGLALDSFAVQGARMPWTANAPTPPRQTVRPAVGAAVGTRPPPAPAGQPDLNARLTTVLWRYNGVTRHQGIGYRRVADVFCSSGMTNHGTYSSKRFTLPDVGFRTQNVGSDSTGNAFQVRIVFGGATRNESVSALSPGARRDIGIARPSAVQRCVTLGRVPGGCHECAGENAYEDPRLDVIVDANNSVNESNEGNNRLTQ